MTDHVQPAELPFTGLVHVTGEPDTGKTWFSLTVPGVMPQDIVFFDDDLKTQPLADAFKKNGTPFAHYFNLKRLCSEQKKNKPSEYYALVSSLLDQVEKDVKKRGRKYSVLTFDNFSPRMEEAIRSYSLPRIKDYTDLSEGQIAKVTQLTWGATYVIYDQFLDRLLECADLVFILTHIKEQYLGQQKTGKLEARGQRPLLERPSFRVWTRHNPDGTPYPVGLILKRIARPQFTSDGLKAVNVMPRRMQPLTWERVVYYLNNPVGDRKPYPEEIPNPFEASILDGTLTEDMKNAMRAARVQMEKDAEAELTDLPEPDPAAIKAREFKSQGMAPAQIAAELQVEFGKEYSVPQVLSFLK